MTLLSLIHAIVGLFTQAGAHHVAYGHHADLGYIISKHWVVAVCKIPAGLHGTFHCTGVVNR
jgi:hypothetical protein